MVHKVNLDALIIREDFEVSDDPVQFQPKESIEIRDLEADSFFYLVLRKPDFQRETADWTPEKISDFIKSFLNGDLIPAIILWKSPNNHVFVIDGAHRISALIAWVQDDYGDGPQSRAFFDYEIPEDQKVAADITQSLVQNSVGDYRGHKFAIRNPDKAKPEVLERARRLASLVIQVQWVRGNAIKAEASFSKINQQAAPIDATEFRLIEARKKANALAARAIIRAGTGHQYWSKFSEDKRQEIQHIAREINDILFKPPLQTPIKTLDLPIAGKMYSSQTLQLVFELINLVNDGRSEGEVLDDDDTGDQTIHFLKTARKIIFRISGMHASSLGLHPAVYFYSSRGRFQPTSFLGVIELIKDFEKFNKYRTFTEHRKDFEEFIVKYKEFSNQIATVIGSGTRGMGRMLALYQIVLDGLTDGKTEDKILDTLLIDKRFSSFLKLTTTTNETRRRDFNSETKSEIYIRESIGGILRCQICQGYIDNKSSSIDHIIRREDMGTGNAENGQITHLFCNTTYKN